MYYTYDNFCVTKAKYIMYNVQIIELIPNNDVRPVVSEGCHFTHTWKARTRPHHFTKREVWAHKISLTPPLFIEVHAPSQESERSCICVLWVSIFLFVRLFY